MKPDKKVLITGGSGFIGQHIAKKFFDSGYYVTIFDITEPTLDELKPACIQGDVYDNEKLDEVVKNHDAVIHLVGLADAGIAQRDPAKSFKLNVLSLQNVLEACHKFGGKKLIFPSSAAVYGLTEDLPVKESFPLNPTNMYSWHKYVCEKLIKAYHDNYGIDYVILRLFNVYGAGHKGVIEIFLEKAKNGETIESFGPYQYRDFVYAGDVAAAMYKAAIYEKVNNRAVNVGSGRGVQIKELLDLICKIYPKAKWVETKAKFTVYDSIADITLAKILLDFKPHDPLEFMEKIIKEEMM
jgi:UDP-glucose 4-epimerase